MEKMNVDRSRREFLVKVAYTAPLIATLSVMPSLASAGSPVIGGGGTEETTQPLRRHHKNHNNQWHPF
jgi:hypothetical protein